MCCVFQGNLYNLSFVIEEKDYARVDKSESRNRR